ncbi:hypothetical protein OC846_005597 [Tilletia horrida]|uniref:Uncharacterized protein n=1 Tax=Tilletia horrida TaxID=155126 RepID=A0AAN6GLH8_9BASI|nr:hypothetical protein OC846_005597 [Tilletia horrida]KAK0562969.1 hypothetical protein OC861_005059 [Tilletia horrida]
MLSTSVNGVAAPASAKFEFVPCNSSVLRSDAGQQGANGRSFGLIRPVGQPTRCITLSYTSKNTTARAFINAPCNTVDSISTLAPQWFGAFYYTFPTPGIGNRFVVQLVGDTNLNTTGYWIYHNVASSSARLFEASWHQTGTASIPYNLYMSQTLKSG